jgi:hypothetical protein
MTKEHPDEKQILFSIGSSCVVVSGRMDCARTILHKAVPRQTWEYAYIEFNFFVDTSKLNQLGSECWQLVAVTSICSSEHSISPGCKYTAYLKREKRQTL